EPGRGQSEVGAAPHAVRHSANEVEASEDGYPQDGGRPKAQEEWVTPPRPLVERQRLLRRHEAEASGGGEASQPGQRQFTRWAPRREAMGHRSSRSPGCNGTCRTAKQCRW